MTPKNFFSFTDTSAVGIDFVPVDGVIHIDDSGSGLPKIIILRDTSNMTDSTTIDTLLTTYSSQWDTYNDEKADLVSPTFTGTVTLPSGTETVIKDTSPQLGGDLDVNGKAIIGTIENYSAIGASDIDCSLGSVFSKTISGATTLTVSNIATSGLVSSFILELTNSDTDVTWWSGIKWAGGTAPTLTTTGLDLLGFYTRDGGTTWRGNIIALDSQ